MLSYHCISFVFILLLKDFKFVFMYLKMELPEIIYPPNRPFERSLKPSQTPILYDFLFFIEANRNGEFILGCSNVAGTYWEGTLFHYMNFKSAKKNSYSSYFISTSTTSDAKYISDNYVLLAEDNGDLKLLMLPDKDMQLPMECKDTYHKNDRITQLTVWNTSKFAACTESCINLYDIQNGSSIKCNKMFKNYHTDSIFSIDANKLDEYMFVSTSADRKACIWDTRMDSPATVIYNSEFSALTSAVWCPNNNYIVVGTEAGDIYLLNIKQTKDVLASMHCFDSSIHKICFSPQGNLAVCGNAAEILVYDCHGEQFNKVYENQGHNTIIRGLTWYKNDLYSCGFNKKLASHCC